VARRRTSRTPASSIRSLEHALATLAGKAPPEDVTRARAETLLHYLAAVPVPILIANNRARYIDANPLAVKLTGYPRKELTQLSLWDLTPNPNRRLGARLWRNFLKRGRMAGEYVLTRKDGTFVTAKYLAVANVLPGVHVSALVPLTPVTPRRKRRY